MRKHSSLRTKIIFLYVMLALIPILIISFFSFVTYTNDTNKIENALLDYAIVQTSDNLYGKLANYKNIITQIGTNREVINLFKQFNQSEQSQVLDSQSASVRNKLINRFMSYMQMDNYITSIALITNSLDASVFDRYDFSSYSVSRWGSREYRNSFAAYGGEANLNTINVISAVDFPGAPNNVSNHVYFTFPAMDIITKEDYGILIMEVDNSIFNSIIKSNYNNSTTDTYISTLSSLTDNYGNILISPNHEIIGLNMSDLKNINLSKAIYKSNEIKGTSIKLNLIFEKKSLQKYIDKFLKLVILLTIAITICFIIVVYILTGSLWNKARKIGAAIQRFRENQQDVDIDIDRNDEILYSIEYEFNKMMSEITALVAELKEKNEHVAIMMDQRRKAEIRALQAQINPHFLYNALDRINWIAIDNDQHEISSLLSGLANLLRYSISNIDILVPLKDEIQWMEKYIFIQCKRFNREIDFICNTYGDAIDFPIYKMLLQPLVENSILHGFDNLITYGHIELYAKIIQDARLEIILSDNGRGMDQEVLTRIQHMIEKKGDFETESIGINNVISRLWLYYGDEAQIRVECIKNVGTKFILIIPYKEQS